jgi:hypothetical protein
MMVGGQNIIFYQGAVYKMAAGDCALYGPYATPLLLKNGMAAAWEASCKFFVFAGPASRQYYAIRIEGA